jgi:hypothetical protein
MYAHQSYWYSILCTHNGSFDLNDILHVSFSDDFSKVTWIYLLKKCSDVYQVFLNYQQYVERKFNMKIVTMQSDWGVIMRNSMVSFKKLASHIMSLLSMPTIKMVLLKENTVI